MVPAGDTDDAPGADFDLSAAGLRADGTDLRISVDVLASKLEDALPAQTRVERRGGGFLGRGPKRVRQLSVELGDTRYQLSVSDERVECSRGREVAGISIKRETLAPAVWVSALTDDLRSQAQLSSHAREALTRLLD